MKILSIETSCDETAISILNFKTKNKFNILSNLIISQIDIHKEYGGVYPTVAKREHISNLFPLFLKSLKNSKLIEKRKKEKKINNKLLKQLKIILRKDKYNLNLLIKFYEKYKKPKINIVTVTYGPGLEIALWTGFNFAKSLSILFNINLVPVNHMEGHIFSSLIKKETKAGDILKIIKPEYPSLVLLISGGHTELQLIKDMHSYKLLGSTLDDAVGEAFDKTARLLNLSYPGGPEISKLAKKNITNNFNISLPRPMLNRNNLNFSFSGLKTSVLYLVKKQKKISVNFKEELSKEFENSVSEVLIKKTKKAIQQYKIKSLIIGGGVIANNKLRKDFLKLSSELKINLFLPEKKYTGDNGLMIAVAGYLRYKNNNYSKKINKVDGNLKLK